MLHHIHSTLHQIKAILLMKYNLNFDVTVTGFLKFFWPLLSNYIYSSFSYGQLPIKRLNISSYNNRPIVLPNKLIFTHLVRKFPTYYANPRFIIIFTTAHYWILPQTN
jgi:hypothetical protein